MVVAVNVSVNAQSNLTNSYKGYVDAGYSIGKEIMNSEEWKSIPHMITSSLHISF